MTLAQARAVVEAKKALINDADAAINKLKLLAQEAERGLNNQYSTTANVDDFMAIMTPLYTTMSADFRTKAALVI